MDFIEIEWRDMDHWRALMGTVMNISVESSQVDE
jgi:hypothetical protein